MIRQDSRDRQDGPNRQESQDTERPEGRRARLWGLARATRDTYIPRLAGSVKLFAARAPEVDETGAPLAYPRGTTFTLYPLYTRANDTASATNIDTDVLDAETSTSAPRTYGAPGSTFGSYAASNGGQGSKPGSSRSYTVEVRGWMWCPGVMSRKNRLILSLAKQITKYGGGAAAAAALQAMDRLEDPSLTQDTADDALVSSESTSSSETSMGSGYGADSEKLIRERMSLFIARLIPNAQVNVVVGSADANTTELTRISVFTDSNGFFDTEVVVPYEPSVVQANAAADDTICTFQAINVVDSGGYGIISDIDDTIKLTGVIGDKRELMHRLLLGDVISWSIPSVVQWFQELAKHRVTFHYVSNSPWQLYTLISQYFGAVNLPPGSVHLKQYTGNIVRSLMEPSSSRKRKSLFKIIQDFPNKKFICVGDSGERDWESYADLAASYPGQVKHIYIRVVPDSLLYVNDDNILDEINRMINDWMRQQQASDEIPDLIDMDTLVRDVPVARLPPLVPKKPTALRATKTTAGDSTRGIGSNPGTRPGRKPPPEFSGTRDSSTDTKNSGTSEISKQSGSNSRNPGAGNSGDSGSAPPLPKRRYPQKAATDIVLSSSPPLPGSLPGERSWTDASSLSTRQRSVNLFRPEVAQRIIPNIHNLNGAESFYELEDVDKRGAQWLERVAVVLRELNGTGTTLRFFRDSDDNFFQESLRDVD